MNVDCLPHRAELIRASPCARARRALSAQRLRTGCRARDLARHNLPGLGVRQQHSRPCLRPRPYRTALALRRAVEHPIMGDHRLPDHSTDLLARASQGSLYLPWRHGTALWDPRPAPVSRARETTTERPGSVTRSACAPEALSTGAPVFTARMSTMAPLAAG